MTEAAMNFVREKLMAYVSHESVQQPNRNKLYDVIQSLAAIIDETRPDSADAEQDSIAKIDVKSEAKKKTQIVSRKITKESAVASDGKLNTKASASGPAQKKQPELVASQKAAAISKEKPVKAASSVQNGSPASLVTSDPTPLTKKQKKAEKAKAVAEQKKTNNSLKRSNSQELILKASTNEDDEDENYDEMNLEGEDDMDEIGYLYASSPPDDEDEEEQSNGKHSKSSLSLTS